jgi:hypothetical protein
MDYDPNRSEDRRRLAADMIDALVTAGFAPLATAPHGERVFTRAVAPDLDVSVWTSVEGIEARACGTDAIRVALVYCAPGKERRGVARDVRVHRTGTIPRILARLEGRIARTAALAGEIPRCRKCGAPTFESSKGARVCAALCWKPEVAPEAAPVPAPVPVSEAAPVRPLEPVKANPSPFAFAEQSWSARFS